jgi:phosphatidylglycerophosphate synthase
MEDRFDRGPAVGAALQMALLALLAATVGLGPVGWLAGGAHALVVCAALTIALRRNSRALSPADRVTLARAVLSGGVTALVADTVQRPAPMSALVAITAVALLLDAVDGKVARRTGTVSKLGARFDMETDAFLILVLSVFVAESLGPWVLAIGAMRYVFDVASRLLPWMTAQLPHSMARKTVAALQGIFLLVAASDLLPHLISMGVTGLALASLTWSFGRDTRWLYRHRAPKPVPAPKPVTAPKPAPAKRPQRRYQPSGVKIASVGGTGTSPRTATLPGRLISPPTALRR